MIYTEENMDQIKVKVEADEEIIPNLGNRLRERIGLRIDVERAEPGSLPRYELKAKRVVDNRIR